MKRVGKLLGLALLGVLAVCVVRAVRVESRAFEAGPEVVIELDAAAATGRLSKALQCATVSDADPARTAHAELERLARHLEASFPRTFALPHEKIGAHALLFSWRGSDDAAAPVMLMAHQDVVPVEAGTERAWTHPPFQGVVEGGFVWGRGALDDKGALLAILEATEALLARGFRPRATVYLAFGADEEVGGHDGAVRIVEALRARGVKLGWVLDEGTPVSDGIVTIAQRPVALVATAEKGYVSLELVARARGGHSSMPPDTTAVGRVARAVARIEERPMPATLAGPTGELLDALAPELPAGLRFLVANRWLFDPLVLRGLLRTPQTAAGVRTTLAATMFHAGVKDNVLPQEARAVVNARVHPTQRVEDVVAHVRRAIDDAEVEVKALPGLASEPSPVSRSDGPGFVAIARAIRRVFPEAAIAPALMVGASDARHTAPIAADAYRFGPWKIGPGDLPRVHGTDERISIEGYLRGVRFYAQLLGGL